MKVKPYKGFSRDFRRLYGREYYVLGPYRRKSDGRKTVCIRGPYGNTTKQYAKVKLEIKLGRILGRDETVDHKDGNYKNDNFYNLELLSLYENAIKGALRLEVKNTKCVWCDDVFTPSAAQVKKPRNEKMAGPFCSKSCSGKYGKWRQNGGVKLKRKKVQVEYFTYNNGNVRTLAKPRV